MTEQLKQYEKSIKRKHSFGWTPKFEEEISTNLSETVLTPIVVKTFETLGWIVVYQDEERVEAKRGWDWTQSGNKITVTFNNGKIKIKSICLGNEMWDFGRNSLRVKLFIHAFNQTEKGFDSEALKTLEIETEKVNNWDNYTIPVSLPQAKKHEEPQFWIPVAGGIITALVLGLILAFLSVKGIYIIGIFEVAVGFAIGFALQQLIKVSNYTLYDKLHYLLIGIIVLTYVSNQYFQYQIILLDSNFEPFSFWEFMQARFNAGLRIKDINTGWIGLIISWILQLVITYYLGVFRLTTALIEHFLKRVPSEVVEFAIYHFIKEKTEGQVRIELAKMGWKEAKDQDDVFGAIAALKGASDVNRME